MKQAVIFNKKKIGEVDLEKNAYICFRTQEHLFIKYNGFGLSSKVMDFLYSKNIDIVVLNFENKIVYYTNLDNFLNRGIEYWDEEDLQYILPLRFWSEYNE